MEKFDLTIIEIKKPRFPLQMQKKTLPSIHASLAFNFVNNREIPTTTIVTNVSADISIEFASLNNPIIPNAPTAIKRIGNKYFNVKTHVFQP